MQLTRVGRGREQIGREELEGLRASETHLSELIGQRSDIWRSLLLAIDRLLLSVSRCWTIVTLGLSVVRCRLALLGLELTVAHQTWGEKLGRSEWLLWLRTASRIGISGVSVCGAIVGLGLSRGVLASFWVTVGWGG